MKGKVVLTGLFLMLLLSGCGLKETINQADKVVKKENTDNSLKQKEMESKALEEENFQSEEYPVKIETYVNMEKDAHDADVSTEKDGEHNTCIIKMSKGKVVETLGSEGDSKFVSSYSIKVIDPKDKTNGKIANGEFGLNLVSGFLKDAKLTDKPINLLFDIDVDKRGEYSLDDTHSLVLDPQDKGYIMSLERGKSTD